MKSSMILSFCITLGVTGLTFLSTPMPFASLGELGAEAACYCLSDSAYDCKSSATGNIYPGHRTVCDEEVDM